MPRRRGGRAPGRRGCRRSCLRTSPSGRPRRPRRARPGAAISSSSQVGVGSSLKRSSGAISRRRHNGLAASAARPGATRRRSAPARSRAPAPRAASSPPGAARGRARPTRRPSCGSARNSRRSVGCGKRSSVRRCSANEASVQLPDERRDSAGALQRLLVLGRVGDVLAEALLAAATQPDDGGLAHELVGEGGLSGRSSVVTVDLEAQLGESLVRSLMPRRPLRFEPRDELVQAQLLERRADGLELARAEFDQRPALAGRGRVSRAGRPRPSPGGG